MLTPLDIESQEFRKKPYGYSIEEVDKFLDDVIESYEKIYKENIELKDKISMLNESIQHYKALEQTLQNTLILAEKAAEDTKSAAYQKGEQIKREAEMKANQILEETQQEVFRINQEIERLKNQYSSLKIQMKQTLLAQLEILEQSVLYKEDEIPSHQQPKEEYDTVRDEDAI
ncbi:DivIVA domain-containing protein [Defluviitalea raffinosedens]|jgi:cell division initiation protein|nr:DivIVA domain-containing protein [Defluviitalea raffinosedens]MBM7686547.1 cell division initiation protein [Defluviitalea raffinosedens]MBZ4669489.1 DivIVA protein [Defluviitaleaceae bacterium]